MYSAEVITPQHLARKAVINIRQSTPHQALSHQESLRLQYALTERARALGWAAEAIDVIDTDVGHSAASAQHREGFNTLVGQVTLGQVGLILSYDVTRLSRNCSDWYPLLDLCGYKSCLIADVDGLYDPATANGRLLLGVKGTLSEWELHTIRARMTAGLLNKAARGDLALTLPTGLERDILGRVHKDPNLEVQARIALVFETFLQRRSASKVLEFFNARGLRLPRRDHFGEVVWKRPTVAAILSILKHPAYAGTFTYGRTRTLRTGRAAGRAATKRLTMEQWRMRVPDKYPAYISWATFEQIQTMLRDNHAEYDRKKTRGIPRPGKALLHGLVYCGACGHKMVVQYKGGTEYLCNYLRQQYRVPVCQYVPADPVDARVVAAFFEALSPVELDLYTQAMDAQYQQAARLEEAHQQQLERLRYEAALSERQFRRVDPDNRLVAAELERRWEAALRALQTAEEATTQRRQSIDTAQGGLAPELRAAFLDLGRTLPDLWQTDILSQAQRKALLRCLIDKVIVHRVPRDEVQTRIVWKGGATTTFAVPVSVGAFADLHGAAVMEQQILTLFAAGHTDEVIAAQLTQQGYRSPQRLQVLPSTVRTIRLKHGRMQQRHQSHPRHVAGSLTVPQLARRLGVSPHWLYDRLANGRIQLAKDPATGLYLFPDQPTTVEHLQQLQAGMSAQVCFQGPTADIHPQAQGGSYAAEESNPQQNKEEIRISKCNNRK
jgi:DNA invertase Pin-like site-specific DNA recombinase